MVNPKAQLEVITYSLFYFRAMYKSDTGRSLIRHPRPPHIYSLPFQIQITIQHTFSENLTASLEIQKPAQCTITIHVDT